MTLSMQHGYQIVGFQRRDSVPTLLSPHFKIVTLEVDGGSWKVNLSINAVWTPYRTRFITEDKISAPNCRHIKK